MKIYKKYLGSGTMRMPKKVEEILSGEVTMIQVADTVVMVKGRYIRKSTMEALNMIIDMIDLASKLEEEEAGAEIEKGLG